VTKRQLAKVVGIINWIPQDLLPGKALLALT